jgi:hypothetical protein
VQRFDATSTLAATLTRQWGRRDDTAGAGA